MRLHINRTVKQITKQRRFFFVCQFNFGDTYVRAFFLLNYFRAIHQLQLILSENCVFFSFFFIRLLFAAVLASQFVVPKLASAPQNNNKATKNIPQNGGKPFFDMKIKIDFYSLSIFGVHFSCMYVPMCIIIITVETNVSIPRSIHNATNCENV